MSSPAVTGPRASEDQPSPLDPIPLPETRRTSRRRERRRDRARRRRLAAVLLGVLAATAAVVTVAAGRNGGGMRPAVDGRPAGAVPPPAPLLLALQDGRGRAGSLFVLSPATRGGHLVLLPPGTMTEVPSLGLEPVGRTLELGGPTRLEATVENLLGVELGGAVVVDAAGLGDLVRPAAPLIVDVPQRVEQLQPDRTVRVLYEPGPTEVAPEQVGTLLDAKGRGNDLARLARHQAFWDAWLARLRARPGAVPAEPPALRDALGALARGPVTTRVVPVAAVATSDADGELYQVEEERLRALVQSAFPRLSPGGDRPRLQILNGAGGAGLAQEVGDRLGPGFEVKLTGNAPSFDFDATRVVYYDRADRATAERVRRALGVGTLVFSRRPLDVVDVTIIVGKDFTRAP